MKKLHFFSILLFLSFMMPSFAQDFHASTTKVEIISGDLVLATKFFTSDLEKAVGTSTSNKAEFDKKAKSYSVGKFEVKINGTPVAYIYEKSETSDKSTRLFFKVENVSNIKELEVKNAMLIEKFEDQQNLLTFDINGVRKSLTTKKGNESGKVTF